GIIFMAMGGLKPNVEFLGGYEAQYLLRDNGLSAAALAKQIEGAGVKGVNVKFGDSPEGRLAIITAGEGLPSEVGAAQAKLNEATGFSPDQSRGFQSVGPSVREETLRNAILGVVLSTGLIILYLTFRFGVALGGFVVGLRFAFSAIGALIHDVIFVIGMAALGGFFFGWEVSALFISAMLTVIGFSTHDTIVIFDRLRENLRKPLPGENIEHLMNRSITQSFARSINTSITVIATLVILIFWGSVTPDLKLFNAAMLLGILAGTYSSIFNAAPILYIWDRAVAKSKGEEHSLLGIAAQNRTRVSIPMPQADLAPAAAAGGQGTGSYGQVKRRRASEIERSRQNLDDE
ncbi:MAG TPA: protein translocase subunit SecF, partial [Fimbriimonadaceae bacterium]|nr:protein translocase subunit SecF [Fimbriimonadaceae bacterium]